MSLWSRILLILKVWARWSLDRAEDPRETLNYADERQQELLRKVMQCLIEVIISIL